MPRHKTRHNHGGLHLQGVKKMANICGVGQVAEWFKAAVLKPRVVHHVKPDFWQKSNEKSPRISRCSRIVQRFAMAHMSSHMKRAEEALERLPCPTDTKGVS